MRKEINFVKVICVQPFTFTNAGIRVMHRMILHLLQSTIGYLQELQIKWFFSTCICNESC